jgi:hypothetical protein
LLSLSEKGLMLSCGKEAIGRQRYLQICGAFRISTFRCGTLAQWRTTYPIQAWGFEKVWLWLFATCFFAVWVFEKVPTAVSKLLTVEKSG